MWISPIVELLKLEVTHTCLAWHDRTGINADELIVMI